MTPFNKSKWIWADCEVTADQYTEYLDSLGKAEGQTLINISCDSDYTLFVNGEYAASNQYGDFEHYKIYDTVDLTSYLTREENSVKILVHYFGTDTQRYRKGAAGLIYEVVRDGEVIAHSDEATLSRLSPTYVSGQKRLITGQLGFSFTYDAAMENEEGYRPSVTVNKAARLFKRPTEKLKVLPPVSIKSIKKEPYGYLIDLGREVVGFARLEIFSDCEQLITVSYGESLDDGRVRMEIGARRFCFEYRTRIGKNSFTNYMLRLGCRYMEVICAYPIKIDYVGILPQIYPVEELPCKISAKAERRLYDASVNTLKLCMMEHYVDTPWREQCLYAFDSYNQMLCGYYAFADKNKEYARASLKLLSEDRREDGLLSICSPCGIKLTIPSFSLYYIIAMKEYAQHTGDLSLVAEYSRKMEEILDEFLRNSDTGGLIMRFTGAEHWNFYDWSEHLEGSLCKSDEAIPDLVINCLFVMALDCYEDMCNMTASPFKYGGTANELRKLIRTEFGKEGGMLTHRRDSEEYTALGNSLAVLCGAFRGDEAIALCDKIAFGKATPSSLSMNIWKYEAMLRTDAKRYREYILGDIRVNYKPMLEANSDTVWETSEGSVAFDNAGSLCHGWSAVPIYIYHRLGVAKYI